MPCAEHWCTLTLDDPLCIRAGLVEVADVSLLQELARWQDTFGRYRDAFDNAQKAVRLLMPFFTEAVTLAEILYSE